MMFLFMDGLQELQEIASIVLKQPASTHFRPAKDRKARTGPEVRAVAACQGFSYSGG